MTVSNNVSTQPIIQQTVPNKWLRPLPIMMALAIGAVIGVMVNDMCMCELGFRW